MSSGELKKILVPYQKKIENEIRLSLTRLGADSKLKAACEYAMTNGKRFRPALVMMMANALLSKHSVIEAALAVEFFHTASLIADDLPCMDDDDERREVPALHKAFGEASALLASYALIAAGYEALARNARQLELSGIEHAEKIGLLALENATFNTGIHGATGGQFLDLFPPELSLAILNETMIKKTVSLFETSLVLGWLFGGGNLSKLPLVKKAAYHYGMAFQLADDLEDYRADKKGRREVNAVSLLGKEEAEKAFHNEVQGYLSILDKLDVNSEELKAIADYLIQSIESNPV